MKEYFIQVDFYGVGRYRRLYGPIDDLDLATRIYHNALRNGSKRLRLVCGRRRASVILEN